MTGPIPERKTDRLLVRENQHEFEQRSLADVRAEIKDLVAIMREPYPRTETGAYRQTREKEQAARRLDFVRKSLVILLNKQGVGKL